MRKLIEEKFPLDLLGKATLRGNEYAWPIPVIPEVIEAGRKLKLLNFGGQLQFRIPDGGTCECYWIDVRTLKSMPSKKFTWEERVNLAAKIALEEFKELTETVDFIKEGREAFAKSIDEFIEAGGDINRAMCFVWYFVDKEIEKELPIFIPEHDKVFRLD